MTLPDMLRTPQFYDWGVFLGPSVPNPWQAAWLRGFFRGAKRYSGQNARPRLCGELPVADREDEAVLGGLAVSQSRRRRALDPLVSYKALVPIDVEYARVAE
jgi:hypothetical protein